MQVLITAELDASSSLTLATRSIYFGQNCTPPSTTQRNSMTRQKEGNKRVVYTGLHVVSSVEQ